MDFEKIQFVRDDVILGVLFDTLFDSFAALTGAREDVVEKYGNPLYLPSCPGARRDFSKKIFFEFAFKKIYYDTMNAGYLSSFYAGLVPVPEQPRIVWSNWQTVAPEKYPEFHNVEFLNVEHFSLASERFFKLFLLGRVVSALPLWVKYLHEIPCGNPSFDFIKMEIQHSFDGEWGSSSYGLSGNFKLGRHKSYNSDTHAYEEHSVGTRFRFRVLRKPAYPVRIVVTFQGLDDYSGTVFGVESKLRQQVVWESEPVADCSDTEWVGEDFSVPNDFITSSVLVRYYISFVMPDRFGELMEQLE